MGRKRVKQYLMLLLAIGVIAVVASGSGTFASFNAEVQHNGNTFATGTLLLHSKSGVTTCTSESVSSNSNLSANNCTILFNGVQIGTPGTGTVDATGAITASQSVTQLVVANFTVGVQPGDVIKVGVGGTADSFVAKAAVGPGTPATIPVVTHTSTNAHNTGDPVAVQTYTSYANIELKNAGTLDAQDIKFAFPTCGNSPTQTLVLGQASIANSSPSTLTLNAGSAFGAPSGATIKIGTDTLTLGALVNPGQTVLTISSGTISGGPYTNQNVTFAPFAGNTGGGTLCSSLRYAVIETADNTYTHDSSTPSSASCAKGDGAGAGASGIGCAFSGSFLLNGPTTDTLLSIANTNGGNTSGELDSGLSRFFVLGIQSDVASLTNTDQNQTATFAVKWHIDQK